MTDLDGSSNGKDFLEHVLSDSGAQVTDVQVSTLGFGATRVRVRWLSSRTGGRDGGVVVAIRTLRTSGWS